MPSPRDYMLDPPEEPADWTDHIDCPRCGLPLEDGEEPPVCQDHIYCNWPEEEPSDEEREAARAELRLQHSYRYGPHRRRGPIFCPPVLPEPSQMELL